MLRNVISGDCAGWQVDRMVYRALSFTWQVGWAPAGGVVKVLQAPFELSFAAGAFARWIRPSHSHLHKLKIIHHVGAAVICLK